MRTPFLLATLLCVACTTPDGGQPAAEGGLAISLGRDVSDNRPVLVVTIANRSQSQLCIRRDTVQNSDTHQMGVYLYDARGRAVREGAGYVPPPMEGLVRLEPGEVARGQYYLDLHFRLGTDGRPFPPGMSARVSIPYSHCDDVWALATSTRQPI